MTYEPMTGAQLRARRQALKINAARFCELTKVPPDTLYKWESKNQIVNSNANGLVFFFLSCVEIYGLEVAEQLMLGE